MKAVTTYGMREGLEELRVQLKVLWGCDREKGGFEDRSGGACGICPACTETSDID